MRRRCRSSVAGVAVQHRAGRDPHAGAAPRRARRSASISLICGRRWCRPIRRIKIVDGAPVDPNDRLFVTIAASDGTLPLTERVQTIYPRYLGADAGRRPGRPDAAAVPRRHALSGRGSDLRRSRRRSTSWRAARARASPMPARACIERRIGDADVTVRFPRDWLDDWRSVAAGIDRLIGALAARELDVG